MAPSPIVTTSRTQRARGRGGVVARQVLAAAASAALGLAGCASSPPAGTTPPGTPSASATASGVVERIATRVISARQDGSTVRLTVDPVEWLTGEAAAEAAAAHGDESPPPNDFYVVNDDPTQVEFAVAPGIMVSTVMDAQGVYCDDMACPGMPMAEWLAAIQGPAHETLLSTPYWLTLSDGVVSAVEQQYVP